MKRPLIVWTDLQHRLWTRERRVRPRLCLAVVMARTHRGGVMGVAVTMDDNGGTTVALVVQMLRR